jgi:hypothetical protein
MVHEAYTPRMATPAERETLSKCPHATGCRLYPLFTMKTMLKVWQLTYCEGAFQSCKRFQQSARLEPVPDNLLPNGKILGAK